MKKALLILLSLFYAQEITNITLEQRTDGSGMVDVCYDLTGTEDFSVFWITAEINFDGEWLPVSGASGEIGPTIEVGTEKCFEWNVKGQYPDRYSNNVQIRILANSDAGLCIDIDGNEYETIQIGDQLWMAENLKVTHYNNGDAIQYVQSESSEPDVWENLSTGAYGYYNDDLSHQETYGNLYNWYAVDDAAGICPEGWHVPSDDEYKELEMYLGMSEAEANSTDWRGTNEGSKLADNADLWNSGNLEENGEFGTSGFTGLPAGYRNASNGHYFSMGYNGYFRSSTEGGSNDAWSRKLYYYNSEVGRSSYGKQSGFSIRCVRD